VNSSDTNASKQSQPAIKFNLKFQQQSGANETPGAESGSGGGGGKAVPQRKSRFQSIDHVKQQQDLFKNKQNQQENEQSKSQESNTSSTSEAQVDATKQDGDPTKKQTTTNVIDIVYDINKWPSSLKDFCARVYKHYHTSTIVTEDQVTKYLQQRITNAFKLKPDLNVGWESEALPDIISIKKVAPFSNIKQQIQQKQANISANNMNNNAKKFAQSAFNNNPNKFNNSFNNNIGLNAKTGMNFIFTF
jgi:hypothetical protein